jgi:hypothetical protein
MLHEGVSMLKRFINGLVFGSGFAIAFVLVGAIAMNYVLPRLVTSAITETKQPEFKNPKEAEVVKPDSKLPPETKDFSFFNSGGRMEIPSGGGILSMSPVSTAKGSKRPSTYQLWLTESKLWQIRTNEERVEIEELPYPKNASITNLDQIMLKSLGIASRQSSMTVSPESIAMLKSTGRCDRDETLNGKLKISTEGVVFVVPNPYEP